MSTVPNSDASSPAVLKWSNASSTSAALAVDPPSRSCLVVGLTSDHDNTTGAVPTLSPVSGLTWTLVEGIGFTGYAGDVGQCALWKGVFNDPNLDPGSFNIVANNLYTGGTKPKMLIARVYTEDQVDIFNPIGATAKGAFSSGTVISTSLVPQTSGGGLRYMHLDWNATGVPTSRLPNNTATEIVDSYHNAGLSTNLQLGKSTPTVAGVSETIGTNLLAASSDGNWIAYELRGSQLTVPGFRLLQESGTGILLEDGTDLLG